MPTDTWASPNALARFARLLVLANLAVFLVLASTAAVALVYSRTAYTARALSSAENLARVLSLNIGAEIKQIDNALASTLIGTTQASGDVITDQDLVARVAARQLALVPQVDTIRVTDSEGYVINGSSQPPVTMADRDYFKAAQATPDRLVVSEPLQGRIIRKPGVIMARARLDGQGRFQGVVYSGLSTDHFVDMFDDVAIGNNGAVSLRTGSLRLIARYAPGASAPGSDVGSAKVSAELTAALAKDPDHGSLITRTAADGVERVSAYQRVQGYPLLVLVGLGTEEAFRPWWRETLALGGLGGLLELLVVGLSLRVYRQQRRQVLMVGQMTRLTIEQQALLDNELAGLARFRDRMIVWTNRTLSEMFGYTLDELPGQPARMFYAHVEDYERVGRGYGALSAGEHFRTQLQMRRKDGRVIWIDLSGVRVSEQESLWMMLDITAVKESESKALHVAMHDGLTGLGNRSQLPQALDRALALARRDGRGLAVCYVDLDGFKAVNDSHGHGAGDELLREVARRMLVSVRNEDTLIRMGGDEFVIVLSGLSERREVEVVLERLLASLQRSFGLAQGIDVHIGASIGIALFPGDGSEAGTLMERADAAMYEAKREGRNRLVFSGA